MGKKWARSGQRVGKRGLSELGVGEEREREEDKSEELCLNLFVFPIFF